MVTASPGSKDAFQGLLHLVDETASFAHAHLSRMKQQFDLLRMFFPMFPIHQYQPLSRRQTSFRQPAGCTPAWENHVTWLWLLGLKPTAWGSNRTPRTRASSGRASGAAGGWDYMDRYSLQMTSFHVFTDVDYRERDPSACDNRPPFLGILDTQRYQRAEG
jgi:hypothetical protein